VYRINLNRRILTYRFFLLCTKSFFQSVVHIVLCAVKIKSHQQMHVMAPIVPCRLLRCSRAMACWNSTAGHKTLSIRYFDMDEQRQSWWKGPPWLPPQARILEAVVRNRMLVSLIGIRWCQVYSSRHTVYQVLRRYAPMVLSVHPTVSSSFFFFAST
jgi:hypothetical protein